MAGAAAAASAATKRPDRRPRFASDIRIAPLLALATRMGNGAIARVAHLVRVLPEITGPEQLRPRLPCRPALAELGGGELHTERALVGVELDDVAVLEKRDRPADGGLRTHMDNAKAAGGTGETW